jgi:hypothetical protein
MRFVPITGIGADLLQSEDEWEARNAVLGREMAELINEYTVPDATDGLEIG